MKHLILKLALAPIFGLTLTLSLLGLMSYLNLGVSSTQAADRTVCQVGPPTCTYTNVQAAVDAAAPGDIIKVAAGTYTGVTFRAGVTQTVYISKSVTIRGDYTTAFSEPPDPQANPTTLDAQGQGRVMYIIGNISPTIEGLRITGGKATNTLFLGGGIYISATATLSNNQVFSNTALVGGGMYLFGSPSKLVGNRIFTNTAEYGGGLVLDLSATILNNNTIEDNFGVQGGGLYLASSAAKFDGNTIVANKAITYGGGVYLSGSNAILNQNVISGNMTTAGFGFGLGGGMYALTSTATLSNNLFRNNKSAVGGGAILTSSPSTLSGNLIISNTGDYGGGIVLEFSDAFLVNNIVADNRANAYGSGIYITGGSPRLLHTTVARNSGADGSGIIVTGWSGNPGRPVLTNTILVSHTIGITVMAGNTATLLNTLMNGNLWNVGGMGLISSTQIYTGNPAFVNPVEGNYHLGPSSAAIDKGINAGITTDIDGEVRPQGLGFDLGADEFLAAPIPLTGVSINGPVTGTLNTPYIFTATISPPTAALPITYTWSPPPDSGQGTAMVTYTWSTTGAKPVIVTATNIGSLVTDTHVTTITDTPISLLNAINDSPTTLSGITTLTATITTGDNVTYTWALGDGAMGNGSVISHTYPAVGVYMAIVTASNSVNLLTTTTTVTITGAPNLSISKIGPVTVTAGSPITYTLTVTNSGSLTATNLVITDTIPTGAVYISGGTKVGNVVNWTVPSLAANGGITQTTFIVTAMQTITNGDYRVWSDSGYTAQGESVVVTEVNPQVSDLKVFVPVILKQ